MSATIKVFHVGEKCFTHVMNTDLDLVELRNEDDEILLVYGADARVTSQEGRMGNFCIEYLDGRLHWVYYEMPLQTRIVFGPDLQTAEVEVSKRYIGKFGAVAADQAKLYSRELSQAQSSAGEQSRTAA